MLTLVRIHKVQTLGQLPSWQCQPHTCLKNAVVASCHYTIKPLHFWLNQRKVVSHAQKDMSKVVHSSFICLVAKQINRVLFNSRSFWASQAHRQHLEPYVCWKNTNSGSLSVSGVDEPSKLYQMEYRDCRQGGLRETVQSCPRQNAMYTPWEKQNMFHLSQSILKKKKTDREQLPEGEGRRLGVKVNRHGKVAGTSNITEAKLTAHTA